jgi:FkbM family methyltransferase
MKILYGTRDFNIDVTEICYNQLMNNNIIKIPSGDNNRANYFTDPINGILKQIFISTDDTNFFYEYDANTIIKINTITKSLTTINDLDINNKIANIHSNLKLNYGSFAEELPEQKMAVRYLTGSEKVLEIGGNIGRNSLIIAYILQQNNNNNFVSLESHSIIAQKLIHNRDLNNLNFFIENSALSKRKLIQKPQENEWDTIESDVVLDGYLKVNIITFDELYLKYNIDFDTLVLDCEGAFYYILLDMPEILNNINLIIMENDYRDITKKNYIDEILIKNNFYVDYVEAGGWGACYNNFFEVWKRNTNL